MTLPLSEEKNTIIITSSDAAGNSRTVTVSVTREAPFLQANLPWFIFFGVIVAFVVVMLIVLLRQRPKGSPVNPSMIKS